MSEKGAGLLASDTYRLFGKIHYDSSGETSTLPPYIFFDNFGVDISSYYFGYIEDEGDRFPVLILNFFKAYENLEGTKTKLIGSYLPDEKIFVLRSFEKTN